MVVESVARRVALRHRRAGKVMAVMAGLTLLLPIISLVAGTGLESSLWMVVFLGSMCGYMYARRRSCWRAADRVAIAAGSRPDLDWTHRRGTIQAHDRNGPRPTLLLQASPRPGDEAALPTVRLLDRGPKT
ncbi:MAG: hypothetical protein JWO36_3955 [Myxococcales bacterium]|nr:hypothetical protein [Myxococcales bacterium]